jgi:hypothetical protein
LRWASKRVRLMEQSPLVHWAELALCGEEQPWKELVRVIF